MRDYIVPAIIAVFMVVALVSLGDCAGAASAAEISECTTDTECEQMAAELCDKGHTKWCKAKKKRRVRPLNRRQLSEKVIALEAHVEVLAWQLQATMADNQRLQERTRKVEWKIGLWMPSCDSEWLWTAMCVQWPDEFTQ
jgi:hypothetical protein